MAKIAEAIKEIAEALNDQAEAMKELPDVTASDNGKVLMVVDGAWAVAALPTGND